LAVILLHFLVVVKFKKYGFFSSPLGGIGRITGSGIWAFESIMDVASIVIASIALITTMIEAVKREMKIVLYSHLEDEPAVTAITVAVSFIRSILSFATSLNFEGFHHDS
jgi:hypothetical protein